jgi:hypothetical protein
MDVQEAAGRYGRGQDPELQFVCFRLRKGCMYWSGSPVLKASPGTATLRSSPASMLAWLQ